MEPQGRARGRARGRILAPAQDTAAPASSSQHIMAENEAATSGTPSLVHTIKLCNAEIGPNKYFANFRGWAEVEAEAFRNQVSQQSFKLHLPSKWDNQILYLLKWTQSKPDPKT